MGFFTRICRARPALREQPWTCLGGHHQTDNLNTQRLFVLFVIETQRADLLPRTQLQIIPSWLCGLRKTKQTVEPQCTPSAIYLFYSSGNYIFLLQEHNRNQSKRVIDTALRINHIFKIIKKFTPRPISC